MRHDTQIDRARVYEIGAAIRFLGRRRAYDDLVAVSGAQTGDHVLDVGCGTGYFTRRVARAVAPDGHALGIDPSPQMIGQATRHTSATCSFQLASAQALPFPNGSFDVVISSLALHHLPPADRPTALREAYRVLRPGGRLLIAEFRRRPVHTRAAGHLLGRRAEHARRHDPIDGLDDLVARAGFHVSATGNRRPWFQYVQAQRPGGGHVDVVVHPSSTIANASSLPPSGMR